MFNWHVTVCLVCLCARCQALNCVTRCPTSTKAAGTLILEGKLGSHGYKVAVTGGGDYFLLTPIWKDSSKSEAKGYQCTCKLHPTCRKSAAYIKHGGPELVERKLKAWALAGHGLGNTRHTKLCQCKTVQVWKSWSSSECRRVSENEKLASSIDCASLCSRDLLVRRVCANELLAA